MSRRRRVAALLAGAVAASSLATVAATTSFAPAAGAAPTAVSTACNYRPFDGKWHMADVTWNATPSVTTATAGTSVVLTNTTLQTTLLPEMAQIGYAAGLLKSGLNTIPVDAWVGIESVGATPRFQVVQASGTATTTITPGTGGTISATPIVADLTVPNSTWTAAGSTVQFRPAPAGTVNGTWPSVATLPGDKTGGVQGGQYVVAELPGSGTPFELTLDCYPGTVDIDGIPEATYAPPAFASVGNGTPEEPVDPEEPEVPVEGDWACLSSVGTGTAAEVIAADVAVTFPSVPQVVGGRVAIPKVRAQVGIDASVVQSLYRSGAIPVGTTTRPLSAGVFLAGANTAERTQRVNVTTTWTSVVTDPTPADRTNGDDTAEAFAKTVDTGASYWTPVAQGPVSFTLSAAGQTGAPVVPVTRADASTYNLRPYGQVHLLATTDTGIATVDCLQGSATVANAGIAAAEIGNYSPTVSGTNPVPGSRGRYTLVPSTSNEIGKTTFGNPAVNTFECLSGLGRYRGREIEPMDITVRQPDPAVISGGKVRVPRTLVDITVTEGLLKSLYQGNQLAVGTNSHKLFGWVYLNGSNTVERTKRLAVETVWETTVTDPTPANRASGDETVTTVKQTLDFGPSSWTPVSRGDVTFSLVAPGGNSAPTIDVIGKGYADTPYTVRPYGNVFLRAETANYGANLDCVAGKAAIVDGTTVAYHNFGNYPVNPTNNLASGSRGRYTFTPAPAAAISTAVVGNPALNTFECISGLGRYRGREIEPFNITAATTGTPVVSGSTVTLPNVDVSVNVTAGLLKSLYAAGQFDNTALATDFTTTQLLEGWVYLEGNGTTEGTQRLKVSSTYDVTVKDPTPANKTNSDETIAGFTTVLSFGSSTWTADGPSKVTFGLADPGQEDAPKIDVIGTGYADTPYSIRPFGSVFLRAGTDHYGANLDCTPGKVTIADAAIPYHNFGNDPRNAADNLASGSRGRYAFAPTDVALGGTRTGSANERYVNAVFKNPLVLDRAVDPSGLAYWSGKLTNGLSRKAFATTVTASAEARRLWVAEQFRTILGRESDAAGVAYWAGKLGSGTTYPSVQAQLLGSAEFRTKAGGTTFGVVDALFDRVLRRAATDAERTTWGNRLTGEGGVKVATALLATLDAKRVIVDDSFQLTLGRGVDASGREYWAKKLQGGTATPALLAELLASTEFVNRNV